MDPLSERPTPRPRDEPSPGELRVEEIRPASDPVVAFRRLAALPHAIFLDSAVPGDPRSRRSLVAACPLEWIEGRGRRLRVVRRAPGGGLEPRYHPGASIEADPFRWLASKLRQWSPPAPHAERPAFTGGIAGLFGYGLGRTIERLPDRAPSEFPLPDLAVGLYDRVVSFDHDRGTCHIVAHEPPATASGSRPRGEDGVRELRRLLEAPDPRSYEPARPGAAPHGAPARPPAVATWLDHPRGHRSRSPIGSDLTRGAYLRMIDRAIEYIRAGDIFQVNLAQRLLTSAPASPVDFYLRLREQSPAPFAGYLDLGSSVVASSSPEEFLRLENGEVRTRPIKGTRPRGANLSEDARQREELLASPKDRAENVMIVDLLRNDLSRVCRPGTVTVPRLWELETQPTVHHLVSEVRGVLRSGAGPFDLLRAAFPGGSVTGAPKVRAMEIIAELEPSARDAYCGSLAWIGFGGDLSASILIRTATCSHGWLRFPVGGGIVADSDPEKEYEETLDKAEGLLRALEAP